MKILLKKPLINIQILKDLKSNKHEITYNENEAGIDIIVDDEHMSFKNYPAFNINYTQWVKKDGDLSFIINLLEETLTELNCYTF